MYCNVLIGTIPTCAGVATRLKILYGMFFPSWIAYPLIYILSLEGACVAEENVVVVCYVLADAIAKNAFAVILWDTYLPIPACWIEFNV